MNRGDIAKFIKELDGTECENTHVISYNNDESETKVTICIEEYANEGPFDTLEREVNFIKDDWTLVAIKTKIFKLEDEPKNESLARFDDVRRKHLYYMKEGDSCNISCCFSPDKIDKRVTRSK